MSFHGKIALVTGAASGIGRATALALAGAGAVVVVADRRAEKCEEVVAEITEGGGTSIAVIVDIADEESVDGLFKEISSRFGRIDLAVNNAGVESNGLALPDTPVEAFDRVFGINVRGIWLCLRHEMKMMREFGSGSIVNTSSIAGVIGYQSANVYTASKHAIVGMTKSAALDFAELGIRINCLCPGGTHSEQADRWVQRLQGGESALAATIPMRRMGEPEEQAAAVLFLLSDAASYVTGHTMIVDGGTTIG